MSGPILENCCWAGVAAVIIIAAAWTGNPGFLGALLVPLLALNTRG